MNFKSRRKTANDTFQKPKQRINKQDTSIRNIEKNAALSYYIGAAI